MKTFVQPDGVTSFSSPTDYQYGDLATSVTDMEDFSVKNKRLPKVNQAKFKESKKACTIVNRYKELCYLRDKQESEEEMLEFIKNATLDGYVVGQGRGVPQGADSVRKYWNKKYPEMMVTSMIIKWDHPDFLEALRKGHMLGFSYGGNASYNKDYQSDNMLNGSKFGTHDYRHTASVKLMEKKICVWDSYCDMPYNLYSLEKFGELIQNNVLDERFVLWTKFLPDNEDIKRMTKMKIYVEGIIDYAERLKAMTNDDIYKSQMQQYIFEQMDKLADIKKRLATLGALNK